MGAATTSNKAHGSRIVAVFTLYDPSAANIQNVCAVARQCDVTLCVDNSSASNRALLEEGVADANVVYVPNYMNLGLSGAFNTCLGNNAHHRWHDDDLVVFFDQDTVVEPDHLARLARTYEHLERAGRRVGCVGPAYFETNTQTLGIPKIHTPLDETNMLVQAIITSSMIARYRTLREVGFWSEDVFLDLADYDLCWKMRAAGYDVILTTACVISHQIGEAHTTVFARTVNDSKPFREYYQMRDRLYLIHKDYVPRYNKLVLRFETTLGPLVRLATRSDRKERAHYMRLGKRDYRHRVHGPLTDQPT